jgi:hypothetical protein
MEAGSHAESFIRQRPDLADGQLVLAAIPANLPPPRRLVTQTETIAELYMGATLTTERPGMSI